MHETRPPKLSRPRLLSSNLEARQCRIERRVARDGVGHAGERWADANPVENLLHTNGLALREELDRAVGPIANPPG